MTTPAFDLEPAALALERVIAAISDDQLDNRTPCSETRVGTLIAHVVGLTEAFRQAAGKENLGHSQPPAATGLEVFPDWRTQIPAQLKNLVTAWRDAAAWEGDTEAGSIPLPAPIAATIALDELTIHGWDLARATAQPYTCDPETAAVLLEFLRDTPPEGTPGLFGPIVPIPAEAPIFDRILGLTGRDPAWTP